MTPWRVSVELRRDEDPPAFDLLATFTYPCAGPFCTTSASSITATSSARASTAESTSLSSSGISASAATQVIQQVEAAVIRNGERTQVVSLKDMVPGEVQTQEWQVYPAPDAVEISGLVSGALPSVYCCAKGTVWFAPYQWTDRVGVTVPVH